MIKDRRMMQQPNPHPPGSKAALQFEEGRALLVIYGTIVPQHMHGPFAGMQSFTLLREDLTAELYEPDGKGCWWIMPCDVATMEAYGFTSLGSWYRKSWS